MVMFIAFSFIKCYQFEISLRRLLIGFEYYGLHSSCITISPTFLVTILCELSGYAYKPVKPSINWYSQAASWFNPELIST